MIPDWATRRVRLRSFDDSDVPFYVELAGSIDSGRRYRAPGALLHPSAREHFIYDGVLSHVVGVGRDTGRRLGVVTLSSADLRSGTTFLDANPPVTMRLLGLPVEVTMLGIQYSRDMATPEDLHASAGIQLGLDSTRFPRYFRREGILTDHAYLDGEYWDVHMLATTRDLWATSGSVAVRRMGLPAPTAADLEDDRRA